MFNNISHTQTQQEDDTWKTHLNMPYVGEFFFPRKQKKKASTIKGAQESSEMYTDA